MLEKPKYKISRHPNHYHYDGNAVTIHTNIKLRKFLGILTEKESKDFVKNEDKFFSKKKKLHKPVIDLYFKIKEGDIIGIGNEFCEVKMVDGAGNLFGTIVDNELVDTEDSKFFTFVDLVKNFYLDNIDLLYRPNAEGKMERYKDEVIQEAEPKEENGLATNDQPTT